MDALDSLQPEIALLKEGTTGKLSTTESIADARIEAELTELLEVD
ncbi:hypothetical protein [Actinocrispum sp. NPDC049592]